MYMDMGPSSTSRRPLLVNFIKHVAQVNVVVGTAEGGPLCSNCLQPHGLAGFGIRGAAPCGAQIKWLVNRVTMGDTYCPSVIINNAAFHFGQYIIWSPYNGLGTATLKVLEN